MADEDEETGGLIATLAAALRDRSGVIIGVVGLVGWLAMIWFMFGDVM